MDDAPHRAMASPVGRRFSSFASARASLSARRTRSADPGLPFWLASSPRRLFVARDDETMLSPRRSSPSRHDSAEPKLLVWESAARAEPGCWRSGTRTRTRTVVVYETKGQAFRGGHSGVASFCCPCFFFGRGLQTALFACFSSSVRDSWTARFSRYLVALPLLGASNSTSQLWVVYQLVASFVRHPTG